MPTVSNRLLGRGVIVLVLGFVYGPKAQACGCIMPENISRAGLVANAINSAQMIFVGVPSVLHGEGIQGAGDDLVMFSVREQFKGTTAKQIGVHSGIGLRSASSCGYSFEIGKQYLVFVVDFKGYLSTAACSYTGLTEESALALRVLRKQPLEPEDSLTWHELQKVSQGRIVGAVRRDDHTKVYEPKVYIWRDSDPTYQKEAWFERPDKDGDFESYFLPPGTYRLTAVDDGYGPVRWVGSYVTHPDDDAPGKLFVKSGQDIHNVDIVLHPQNVYDLHGTVRSEDGFPLPRNGVEIRATMTADEKFPFLAFVSPHGEGEFTVLRAPVGRVRLEAAYVGQFTDPNWEKTVVEVEVRGETQTIEIVMKKKLGAAADTNESEIDSDDTSIQ